MFKFCEGGEFGLCNVVGTSYMTVTILLQAYNAEELELIDVPDSARKASGKGKVTIYSKIMSLILSFEQNRS